METDILGEILGYYTGDFIIFTGEMALESEIDPRTASFLTSTGLLRAGSATLSRISASSSWPRG